MYHAMGFARAIAELSIQGSEIKSTGTSPELEHARAPSTFLHFAVKSVAWVVGKCRLSA